MRGGDENQSAMFSFVDLESRVPVRHPLRPIKAMCDRALGSLDRDLAKLYSSTGRPSVPPEQLLRALLLQILYSVRSERLLIEELQYNLLFRWFVGLGIDGAAWDRSAFSDNRDRLLKGEIAQKFFAAVLAEAKSARLLSNEQFSVDGTLIEAWASQKSFQPKDRDGGPSGGVGSGNPDVRFDGQKRSNETHASTTDPDARLRRKGGEGARLVHHGHLVTDNRHGIVVGACVTTAAGNAEVDAAIRLVAALPGRRKTVAADKGYDQRPFVEPMRSMGVTPHVAQNINSVRDSAIDGRTTRHPGYAVSQRLRKKIEEVFGWMKTVGPMRKTRHRGTRRVGWMFVLTAAAYNLVRLRNLGVA
jgi:transposase